MIYRSICRKTTSTDCDTSYNFNQGCGTQALQPVSYGKYFNTIRGGVYALARSKEYGIKIWFWPRPALVPEDILSGGETVNPDWWGTPTAYFPTGGNCGYEQHFDAHMLVFDLTFCVRKISLLWMKRCAHFVIFRATGRAPLWFGSRANVPP